MPARDLGVPRVDAHAPPGQPVQGPRAAVGGHHRKAPENEPRVAVGDRAGHPQRAGQQLPDEDVDEVLALRPSAHGHDEERRAPDLQEQVASDEQPRAPAERIVDRDGHEQAGEHQPHEQHTHRQPVRIEPVRTPRGHVPGVEDRERHDYRLGAGPQIDLRQQVVRELPDREDVDEVEEQLERGDDALGVGRPRDSAPHCRDPTRAPSPPACATPAALALAKATITAAAASATREKQQRLRPSGDCRVELRSGWRADEKS
jgi:hypothetical protein